jgi:hypothetical protein
MPSKNDAPRRARTKQPKRNTRPGDRVKKRLDAWRKAVDRSREIHLEYICFLIHLQILDDPGPEELRSESREAFQDVLRERRAGNVSFVRKMMEDPVGELTGRVERALFLAALDDPDPEHEATSESITAVFNYFGLNPDIASHRGFFLAIVTDVYLNTPVLGRPKGTRARERIWTDSLLLQIGSMLKALERNHPGATDVDLSEILKQASLSAISRGQDGARLPSAGTLRKLLPKARRAYASRFGAPTPPLSERIQSETPTLEQLLEPQTKS